MKDPVAYDVIWGLLSSGTALTSGSRFPRGARSQRVRSYSPDLAIPTSALCCNDLRETRFGPRRPGYCDSDAAQTLLHSSHRCMPTQGVRVDQAFALGRSASGATLGPSRASALHAGPGPPAGHASPDPFLGLVRRTLCTHGCGASPGHRMGGQRTRGLVIRDRVRASRGRAVRRRGLFRDHGAGAGPRSPAAPTRFTRSGLHPELVRRRPGHRPGRPPARTRGRLRDHRDALADHRQRGGDSRRAATVGHRWRWCSPTRPATPRTWTRSPTPQDFP